MKFVENLRNSIWEYQTHQKQIKMHKKVHRLMHEFEKKGCRRYSCETDDGRMKLEWSKK